MIVCIDTNVLLQGGKAGHPFSEIFSAWLQRKFLWAFSNDILVEYEEIITRQSGRRRWLQLLRVLDLAEAQGGLLIKVQPSFQFHIVTLDPDDNKFTDCAITIGADFLITENHHFDPLKSAGYKPQPITPQDFIHRFLTRE